MAMQSLSHGRRGWTALYSSSVWDRCDTETFIAGCAYGARIVAQEDARTVVLPPSQTIARITQLRDFLSEILRGGEPLGPPPTLLRRAHSTAMPELGVGELGGPRTGSGRTGWPELPLAAGRIFTALQVQQGVQTLLADPEIADEREGAGLTTARCKAALAKAGVDPSNIGRSTPALMLWLADAGVLTVPADAGAPWAAPRRFTLRERDAIQVQLCATPAPTPEAVAAERTRGLK